MPVGLLEKIIEYRGFAGAKAMYDRATTPDAQKALPASPMIALVRDFEFEEAKAKIDAR